MSRRVKSPRFSRTGGVQYSFRCAISQCHTNGYMHVQYSRPDIQTLKSVPRLFISAKGRGPVRLSHINDDCQLRCCQSVQVMASEGYKVHASQSLCLRLSGSLSPRSSVSRAARLYICLYVSLSLCLSVSQFLCLSVSLSLGLSVSRARCLSVTLSLGIPMARCHSVAVTWPCISSSLTTVLVHHREQIRS